MSGRPRLSIVIPALDEAAGIAATLHALQPLRERGCEIVLADGGSADGTVDLASGLADRIVQSPRGRALQMNAGAAASAGDVLLFLHADTRLPPDADRLILDGLVKSGRAWGRFDVRLSGSHPLLRVVEHMMNLRSRATGICTGDQGLFVTRAAFARVGGFPPIALMEDLAISRALKGVSPPLALRETVLTSSRRWEAQGVVRTMVRMWRLRLRYFLGADPAELARAYERR